MRKVVSLFLLILLLFSLVSKGSVRIAAMQTCPYMSGKMPLGCSGNNEKKGGCQNCCGCNAMVIVSAPIYIATEPLTLKVPISLPLQTRLPFYRSGELSEHYAADWKPPKSAATHRTT